MKITKRSPFTGEWNTMELPITRTQVQRWEEGMYAQDAFPSLTAEEREFLITGITPEEWDKHIGDEDE